jgi:tripeptide aminopeptidase
MINTDRLAETFCQLVRIDSISREEKDVSEVLQTILKDLGGEISIDNAGAVVGGNTGNLVAKFKGTENVEPMMLCGHMDTVEPGKGIEPYLDNGIFRSKGDTILGADDKSALAIIIEVLRVLKEKNLPHGPLDVVFTICEEVGLLGAKNFNPNSIESRFGYILDSTDREGIFTRAPFACKFKIRIMGKAAHAGASPEKGVSSILLASKAIAAVPWGRIDHETTCNIGKITGGVATNIVAEQTNIIGEARSHSKEKLDRVIRTITDAFESVIREARKDSPDPDRPIVEIKVEQDFPGTNIPDTHPVVLLAKKAAKKLGMAMETKTTGGGADANVFFDMRIVSGVLGTGMTDAHTLQESIALDDMVATGELLLAIIDLHVNRVPL